jgi:hypothetical protein
VAGFGLAIHEFLEAKLRLPNQTHGSSVKNSESPVASGEVGALK